MNSGIKFAVFGAPAPDLAVVPAGALQVSPVAPGAAVLEDLVPGCVEAMVMAAPPGTIERRYALALSLRALKPGAPITVMAARGKGGSRIENELQSFGCVVSAASRRHQRICLTTRPSFFTSAAEAEIEAALAAGRPRSVAALGLWSQPGIFSWDRVDAGSSALMAAFPAFDGRGADLGCGIGILARAVLANSGVVHLDLVDIDRRAVDAARRNVDDQRASFHWADVRMFGNEEEYDFIVTNPPFHDGGLEDRALGEAFIRAAHRLLKVGAPLWLVANRHLPYEAALASLFSRVALQSEAHGFKVYEVRK